MVFLFCQPDFSSAGKNLLSLLKTQKKEPLFSTRQVENSLDAATKSINSQTNNKLLGNDSLTAEVYKHFSN